MSNKILCMYLVMRNRNDILICGWNNPTSYIYVVEAKIFTTRVKHIYIPVWFLQEQFDNGLFIPQYEKSSVITADMCTKTC